MQLSLLGAAPVGSFNSVPTRCANTSERFNLARQKSKVTAFRTHLEPRTMQPEAVWFVGFFFRQLKLATLLNPPTDEEGCHRSCSALRGPGPWPTIARPVQRRQLQPGAFKGAFVWCGHGRWLWRASVRVGVRAGGEPQERGRRGRHQLHGSALM